MDKKDFDIIVCRVDCDETHEGLQKAIGEKLPRAKIKNVNGAMAALIALGEMNYSFALIVTSWERINAAHYMAGQVRLAGLPLHYIFIYATAPGDASKRLQAFQNDFAEGQEDKLLDELGRLLS